MIDLTNIEWIDINLPWCYYGNEEGYPELPNLDEREREVFGTSLAEAKENVEEDLEKFFQLLNELRELQDIAERQAIAQGMIYDDYIISTEYNEIEQDFWKEHQNDPCVIARNAYKDLKDRISSWTEEQPEWKEYQKTVEEYRRQKK